VVVQGRQGGDRYDAKVASLGPGIDLATLTVEDGKLFEARPPMPRAERRPPPNAVVAVYGFPVGGSGLAVPRGVVSRLEYAAGPAVATRSTRSGRGTSSPGSAASPWTTRGPSSSSGTCGCRSRR